MGDIGGMLGLSGGAGGSGFAAPAPAGLYNPVTQPELTQSYSDVQNSMQSQQALLAALQAQNGLGNQNQIYNQMQGVVAGTGPNPAQAMLNQSTGQNVANQAALMAGQRGSSANAGLIARQAAQQGAAAQQQAAGQAATLQANQSLNALNVAGNMANTQAANQIGQTNANTQAQQAEQAALLQAQGAYNTAQVGSQSSQNAGNTTLAQTNMQAGQNIIGGAMQGISMIGGLADGGVVHKYADGGMTSSMGSMGASPDELQASVNANLPQVSRPGAANAPQSKFGRFLKGFGNGFANTPGSAAGQANSTPALQTGMADLVASMGNSIKGSPDGGAANVASYSPIQGTDASQSGDTMAGEPMDSDNTMNAAQGGIVKAMVSPGEKLLSPKEAKEVEKGKKNPAQVGKVVPGTPRFKGNNYANDVVPAKLKEGGVVIPNSIMQSKDPVRGAADFVRAAMAKKKVKK